MTTCLRHRHARPTIHRCPPPLPALTVKPKSPLAPLQVHRARCWRPPSALVRHRADDSHPIQPDGGTQGQCDQFRQCTQMERTVAGGSGRTRFGHTAEPPVRDKSMVPDTTSMKVTGNASRTTLAPAPAAAAVGTPTLPPIEAANAAPPVDALPTLRNVPGARCAAAITAGTATGSAVAAPSARGMPDQTSPAATAVGHFATGDGVTTVPARPWNAENRAIPAAPARGGRACRGRMRCRGRRCRGRGIAAGTARRTGSTGAARTAGRLRGIAAVAGSRDRVDGPPATPS